MHEPITLKRDCRVVEIPSGIPGTLPEGSPVMLLQSLGGSYTVSSDRGLMYRVDAADLDALGLAAATPTPPAAESAFNEKLIWDQLRTVFDPEIPVNIVDLGLIYACEVSTLEEGKRKISVKMSMTAPGCGMGNVLKADVESKLSRLPSVAEVRVEVVLDPPWNPGRMSEAAKLQLGFDLDYGQAEPHLPIYGETK
ncbi:MAG TPA: putative Fe-S cluster assembly protein SufT [Candidatus Cybelea sp.]|nr:putative Fe-S cluster assembly protein SufT [Candidatus Cybelea sp.]